MWMIKRDLTFVLYVDRNVRLQIIAAKSARSNHRPWRWRHSVRLRYIGIALWGQKGLHCVSKRLQQHQGCSRRGIATPIFVHPEIH